MVKFNKEPQRNKLSLQVLVSKEVNALDPTMYATHSWAEKHTLQLKHTYEKASAPGQPTAVWTLAVLLYLKESQNLFLTQERVRPLDFKDVPGLPFTRIKMAIAQWHLH